MFVREFVVDFNATAAARRAGYRKRSAMQIAGHLTRRPAVALAIKAEFEARCRRVDLTVEAALDELRRVGFASLTPFFAADGTLRPVSEWPADHASVVKRVRVDAKGRILSIETEGRRPGPRQDCEALRRRGPDRDAPARRCPTSCCPTRN